jgi:hypothetical protein
VILAGAGAFVLLANATTELYGMAAERAAERIPWEKLNAIAYTAIKGSATSVARWADRTLLGDGSQDASQYSYPQGMLCIMPLDSIPLTTTSEEAPRMSDWLDEDHRHVIQDSLEDTVIISKDEVLSSHTPESALDTDTGSASTEAPSMPKDESFCTSAIHEGSRSSQSLDSQGAIVSLSSDLSFSTDIHPQIPTSCLIRGEFSTQGVQQSASSLDDVVTGSPTAHNPEGLAVATALAEALHAQGTRCVGICFSFCSKQAQFVLQCLQGWLMRPLQQTVCLLCRSRN